MKGYNAWNYAPYIPAGERTGTSVPYICRLAPSYNKVEVEWFHNNYEGVHRIFYSKVNSGSWQEQLISERTFTIEGLEQDMEYMLYIKADNGPQSIVRVIRTGFVPGAVVNYLHPKDNQYSFSGQYLCSPSLVKLPSGVLLASMDVYGRAAPQNLTLIFRSKDGGSSWQYVTDIFPCFWGKMFLHKDALYMLGVSNEYGDLLIGRSDDEGNTWTAPTVIMRGSSNIKENGNHKAPVAVLQSHGRLWTGSEFGCWHKKQFKSSLYSIDENDDLMQANNWTCTGFLAHNDTWPGAEQECAGGIEGNVVESPKGEIFNILRYSKSKALMLKANPDNPEEGLTFYKFIEFPLAHTKFEIQRHDNGIYYAVGNKFPGRTVLSVYTSEDLEHWKFKCDVMNYYQMDIKEVGFQYPSFYFDEDDLLVLSRTAFNNAANFHDSNYITFHRVKLCVHQQYTR
ncbi:MAG TPA: hypothetical protein PK733_02290 [Clostridiales bacterium]|mgnify:CR=1 FL=1|nr:hypothetical protein [Clostridiales bacterium]